MGEVIEDAVRRCTWPGCTSSYRVKYGPISHGWKFGPLGLRLCPMHSGTEHRPGFYRWGAPGGLRLRCGCGHRGRNPYRDLQGLLTEWADHVLNREGT